MSRKEVEETTLRLFFYALPNPPEGGVTRFSTRHPGYPRCLYPKETAGSTVWANRDARPVRPESPLFFSRKFLLFILLSSEKNEPRSAAAVIGPRRSQATPSSGLRNSLRSNSPRLLSSSGLPVPCPIKAGFHCSSFSLIRPSPPFFFPLSPIGRTGLRALLISHSDAVIWSFRTPMRDPGIPAFVIPHIDVESRKYRQKHLQNTLPLRPLSGPRITCGVTRFSMRYPENTGRSTCKIHSPYGPFLDPASLCGVT